MKKIGLVLKKEQSSWVSCRSITRGLIRSYELAFPGSEIRLFHIFEGQSQFESFELSKEIKSFGPELIAFIDHAPHPGDVLRGLHHHYGSEALPRIFVHVFGDFTLHALKWLPLEDVLKDLSIQFICASEKQELLIRSFCAGVPPVNYIPFPVDERSFSYKVGESKRVRTELGYKEGQEIFFYSGRLSLQKNVLLLISVFASYLRNFNSEAILWLAGPTDDLGVPYLGKPSQEGLFANDMMKLIGEAIPAQQREQVVYLGEIEHAQLVDLYRACSYYVSLSTHNDEDYGMAPAEAMLCGAPLLLTDWGGFSSFKKILGENCFTVPVKMTSRRVAPEALSCVKTLAKASDWAQKGIQSEQIAALARASVSCEAVSAKLASLFNEAPASRFEGFSSLFQRVQQAFEASPKRPFGRLYEYTSLYQEVYRVYV